ncbi:hypothetical protein GCM10010247_47010 [Streptomyces calvus]|nr:hypothetical protein GCM10010247_47010 [Streptomyces calvus]
MPPHPSHPRFARHRQGCGLPRSAVPPPSSRNRAVAQRVVLEGSNHTLDASRIAVADDSGGDGGRRRAGAGGARYDPTDARHDVHATGRGYRDVVSARTGLSRP